MADAKNKLASLEALEALAQRVANGFSTKDEVSGVSGRVSTLETAGYQTETQVQNAINAKLSSTYKAGGSLESPSDDKLVEANAGMVYNISAQFTTDAAHFVEGVSKKYPAGTNVVVVSDGGTYKYDVLAGFVDLSEYAKTEDIKAVTKSETNGNIKVGDTEVEVYKHPTAAAQESGLYKVTVDGTGHVTGATAVEKEDITKLGIPGENTTYSDVTANGASGLMTGADKAKLDGFEVASTAEVKSVLDGVFGSED